MSRSILVLTPCRGTVASDYCDAYADLAAWCSHTGIRLARAEDRTSGLLHYSRAALLGRALDSEATHALWLDADVSWPDPRMVTGLLDRPELTHDCIVRPYRGRDPDARAAVDRWRILGDGVPSERELIDALHPWPVRPHLVDGRPVYSDDRALVEVVGAGFGFAIFRVDTLRDFCARLEPDRKRGLPVFAAFTSGATPQTECRHGTHGRAGAQGPLVNEDSSFWQAWCADGRTCWAALDGGPVTNSGIAGSTFREHLARHFG